MEQEVDVHKLTKDNYFFENTIRKMHYDLVEGRWIERENQPQEEDEAPMPPQQQFPALATPPTMVDIMDELREMRLKNCRCFDRLDRRHQAYKDAIHFYHLEYNFPWDQGN